MQSVKWYRKAALSSELIKSNFFRGMIRIERQRFKLARQRILPDEEFRNISFFQSSHGGPK